MSPSFFLAKKYFFSKKKKSFIHFISLMSMIGVCVGSIALVVVLSVFNGLEELNRQIFKAHDPDLKVSPVASKFFTNDQLDIENLKSNKDIAFITTVLQDNALAKNGDSQMLVLVKGVDKSFQANSPLKKAIVDGSVVLETDSTTQALVGGGVITTLGLRTNDFFNQLELWYPKNQKLNVLNPESNISTQKLMVGGVFVLEQQYDNHIYVPLKNAKELFGTEDKLSSLEITLSPQASIKTTQKALEKALGTHFKVENRDQQNHALYKAIKIEKLFIFLSLFFIIGIASFNIFFSLSMLVIDKKDDIKTLSSLGGTKQFIRNIFLKEGTIISLSGAILGFIIGLLICYSQQYFGWLKMGMANAIVDAYPVKVNYSDIFLALFGIIIITFLASYFPAKKAQTFIT